MDRLDIFIKKRKTELKLELKKLKELKKNQRKIEVLRQKVYKVPPMEVFVSWVGSFMDWITDLIKG